MLTYKSSYKWSEGIVLGAVLDFPGTIAYGNSLDEARRRLASALSDMAETNVLTGKPLPIPDSTATDEDADLEEPIHLVIQTGQQLAMTVGSAVPCGLDRPRVRSVRGRSPCVPPSAAGIGCRAGPVRAVAAWAASEDRHYPL